MYFFEPLFWGGGQEYWSGLPLPSPGDLSDPGIECRSLALQADSLPSQPPRKYLDTVKWKELKTTLKKKNQEDSMMVKIEAKRRAKKNFIFFGLCIRKVTAQHAEWAQFEQVTFETYKNRG